VIRDGKQTKGVSISLFMQGTYQLDRTMLDGEIYFHDSCQVLVLLFLGLECWLKFWLLLNFTKIGCDEFDRNAKQRLL
jgi:hypothetical protein